MCLNIDHNKKILAFVFICFIVLSIPVLFYLLTIVAMAAFIEAVQLNSFQSFVKFCYWLILCIAIMVLLAKLIKWLRT